MKKNILLLSIALFVVNVLVAQKVKVKKEVVLIDKQESIKITKDKTNEDFYYALETLEGETVLLVNYETKKISETKSFTWLSMKQPNKDRINEIDFTAVSFSLNSKKLITEFLFKELDFFNEKGFNYDKIDAFFLEKRERESAAETQELEKQLLDLEANFLEVSPEVLGNMLIVSNTKIDPDTGERAIIGKVNRVSTKESGKVYTYTNLTGKVIAVVNEKLRRIEGNNTFYPLNMSFSSHSEGLVKDANTYLKKIYLLDEYFYYAFLTKQEIETVVEQIKENQKEEFETAKENSENLYKLPGYVIDSKGEKVEGEISIVFEKIDVKDPNQWGNVVDLDEANIGKLVSINYINAKGKNRTSSYRSKKKVKFCVDDNNIERCFVGVGSKGKGLELAAGAVSSLSFDTSQFYEVYKIIGDITIYKDVVDNLYLIKIPSEKKALQFNTSNSEKNIENLKKYIGACFKEEFVSLNYSDINDIVKLAEIYNSCSK